MSTTTIIVLVGIGLAVILIIAGVAFLLLRNRRTKKPAAGPKETTQPGAKAPGGSAPAASELEKTAASEIPTEPPKFIIEPPDAQKGSPSPPTFEPFPKEKPITEEGDGADKQKKIRILVVDDNKDTAENVSRLIYFEDDMEVIGQAYTGREGVDLAVELKPHIVLMDINMPDMDGITATQEMGKVSSFSQVIVMSVQADPQYMKRAMAAGARDFQPKPFTADELVSCIRRVYKIGLTTYQRLEPFGQEFAVAEPETRPRSPRERAPGVQNASIIAIYSPKGGTGASTVSANLAVALQQTYGDVALVDADFQFGDIMVHLNIRNDRTLGNLVNTDEIDLDLIDQVLLTHQTGLKLLLAPPKPELADLITVDLITEILKLLKTECQTLVVDTSSQLNDQTLSILDMADHILVVTNPELPAVKSTKLFFELLQALDFSMEHVEVVVNRANREGGIPPEQIKKVLKLKKMYYLPDDFKIHLATNRGQSIYEQGENTQLAQTMTFLANAIWKKINAPQTSTSAQKE
jgi:pilus assembly protein CpaE